ncbi:putative Carrier domain-containing protein [Tenacibaculum sp. 190524A02b]|uniref:aminotransferase class III-fold pyridoxal phosphate-dependent enzyme n=1 Tax=Tenacibaculum vairaonense TaxID=3137860 RepID=UPI0032B27B01
MKNNLFNMPNSKTKVERNWNITKGNKKDVAIIGIGLKFSGCNNPMEYWDLIQNGKDKITKFPAERKEEMNQLIAFGDSSISKANKFKEASYLDQISCFDHGKYKLTKSEATLMSPKQRLFLEVAHQAIEDAGIPISQMKETNTGVYVGHSSYGYRYADFLKGLKKEYFQMSVPGNIEAIIPSRISYLLDLKGPSLLIDTACSSSMVAIYKAYQSIIDGTCDMALAGGVRLMYYPQDESGDMKMGIESVDGKTRTFDESSSGTGMGEGVACILMKPLEKAIKDKNPIYGVLKGGAINQDGKSIGITAPSGKSQKEVLEKAWKNTGVSPEQITYIEAHGTGTKIGDPIEINSIKEAFKKYTSKKQFCAISSVKTNLGHLDSVAGIAGFIKTCLALKHKKIPKQIHFTYPNKEINFVDSPLYVNTIERDWISEEKRFCGVSSFGISGTNCHLILEEAPALLSNTIEEKEYYILPISSYNQEGLKKVVKLVQRALLKNSTIDLYSLGHNLTNRIHGIERSIFVIQNKEELLKVTQQYLLVDKEITKKEIYSSNKLQEVIDEREKEMIADYLEGRESSLKDYYKKENASPIHFPVFPDKPTACWPGENELNKVEKPNQTNTINYEMTERKVPSNDVATKSSSFNIDELYQDISNYIKSIFDSEKINFQQSFFELGFDSISIIQLQQHIKNKYDLELSLEQLYQDLNTVETLTQFVAQNTENERTVYQQNETESLESKNKAVKTETKELTVTNNVNATHTHPFKDIFDKQFEILNNQLQVINNYFNNGEVLENSKQVTKPKQKELSKSNHFKSFKKIVKTKNTYPPKQESYLNTFVKAYEEKTISSKKFAAKNRYRWANNRNISLYNHDWKELTYPIIAKEAKGAYMWDLDGNKYVDFSMGFGVYLLGYNHSFGKEVLLEQGTTHNFLGPISTDAEDVANLIHEITGVDRVAFYNSGTEAVMVALRLARGATNKKKVVVFAGSYHGTFDGVNVDQAADYSAVPLTIGTLPGMVEDVLVLNYGTREAIDIIKEQKDEIAAVLVEPVQSRRVDFQPKDYLQELREITKEESIALIFDEVITGFRIAPGGAQEHFEIKADIVTYGKIIGGGMPIGVVAGKSDYLDLIDGGAWNYGDDSYPSVQRVIVAGTFCHHPLTMKVMAKMLTYLKEKGNVVQYTLNRKTNKLVNELNAFFTTYALPLKANNFGSMFNIKPKSNLEILALLKYHLLHNNVFVWEGATCFISEAHTDDDIQFFINAVKKSIYQIMEGGFLNETITNDLKKDKDKNFDKTFHLPLTIEQKRMYAKLEMNPRETVAFNETVIVEVHKELNEKMLQETLDLVTSRHETLRIVSIDEQKQIIKSRINFSVKYTDSLKDEMSKEAIENWVSKNVMLPFDLKNGPFLRCYVLKTSAETFIVQLVAHHIVVDGWSLNVLLKELNEIYTNYSHNINTSLPKAPQFSTYVNWIHQQLNGNVKEENLMFWKKEFSIEVPRFEIPMLGVKKASNNSGLIYFNLEGNLVKEVREWNSLHKVSLFSTLLSAYKLMLCALSGNEAFRVGIPYAGQLNSRLYDVVGQCVQMIPFISSLDIELTPLEYVNNIMRKNLNILKYPVIPINTLIEDKTTRKNCLYEELVVFNLDKSISTNQSENKDGDNTMIIENKNKYDLFFDALEKKESIVFRVEYNTNKYDEASIQEWTSLYKDIVKNFIKNETLPLKKLLTENIAL